METNIYELLYMVRTGDDWAMNEIFSRYQELQQKQIRTLVSHYTPLHIYLDDLYQEGRIALIQAIDTYRTDQCAGFSTYVYLLTKRRIWTILRHYGTNSYVHMHDTIGLESLVQESECIYDVLKQPYAMNEPEYSFSYTLAKERLEKVLEELSEDETNLLKLWMKNYHYEEAGKRLGISYKAYDGRLQRIRKKIKEAVYYES